MAEGPNTYRPESSVPTQSPAPQAAETLLELSQAEVIKEQKPTRSILRTALIFLLAAGVVYLVISGPSLFAKARYLIAELFGNNDSQVVDLSGSDAEVASAVLQALSGPKLSSAPELPDDSQAQEVISNDTSGIELADNLLIVPKINARAPIIWNSSSDETVILANLKQGVVHYGFTSLPNSESGNVFISGHSSYYWWDDSKYKTIFANLNKLEPGDQAFIQYQDNVYVYEMRDSVTVNPDQVEITDPTTEPILSLMTCVPVGTSLRRLVVRMDLVKTIPVTQAAQELNPQPATETKPDRSPAEPQSPPATNQPAILPSSPTNRDAIQLIPGL